MVSGIRRLELAIIAGLDVAAMAQLYPDWSRVAALCGSPNSIVATIGPDRAIAELTGGLLWCAAVWFGLGLLTTAIARLPGAVGAAGTSLLHKAYPKVVCRMLVGAAGVSIALTPLAADARSFSDTADHGQSSSAVVVAGWPSDTSSPQPWSSIEWPTGGTSTHEPPAGQQEPALTVQRGDSLWSISKRSLGARAEPAAVAAEWPRWYAANRDTIGADPNLIKAGMSLQMPTEESH
ncbi:MAG: hypothetical protein JWN95_596 [Frankiales bacterium]|nr:hypothetical protein [Frankiales bacterium]